MWLDESVAKKLQILSNFPNSKSSITSRIIYICSSNFLHSIGNNFLILIPERWALGSKVTDRLDIPTEFGGWGNSWTAEGFITEYPHRSFKDCGSVSITGNKGFY